MASDFEIGIGARNRASEILREVASQVRSTAETVTQAATVTQEANHRVEISFQTIANVAGLAAAAFAAFKASSFISESFAKFDESKKSMEAFATTIALSSDVARDANRPITDLITSIRDSSEVRDAASNFKSLADSLELATNIDANKILDLMTAASAKGVDSSQLNDMSKAAVGLAQVFGTDLAGGLDKAMQASRGNFSAFENLIPQINELATDDEKLAAVSRLASDGLILKKESASSAAMVFERMTVQTNNLYEKVGKVLSPIQELAYQGFAVLAQLLDESLTPAIEDFEAQFSGMGDSVAESAKWLAEQIVKGFTLAEVVVFNFGTVLQIAGESILLSLETMRADFEYAFMTTIPTYLTWFADNFINILTDMANAGITLVSNWVTNMTDVFNLLWDYLSGDFLGGSDALFKSIGEIANRSLLEGFEPVTEALPEVAERAATELEKTLQDSIAKSTEGLADEYSTKVEERMKALENAAKDLSLDTNIDIKPDKEMDKKMKLDSVPVLQAVESRIMVRGPDQNPNAMTAENTKQTVEELKALRKQTEQLQRAFDRAPTDKNTMKLEVIV